MTEHEIDLLLDAAATLEEQGLPIQSGAVMDAVRRIDKLEKVIAALVEPVKMDQVRLFAGEGRLAAGTVLDGANAELRRRARGFGYGY